MRWRVGDAWGSGACESRLTCGRTQLKDPQLPPYGIEPDLGLAFRSFQVQGILLASGARALTRHPGIHRTGREFNGAIHARVHARRGLAIDRTRSNQGSCPRTLSVGTPADPRQ